MKSLAACAALLFAALLAPAVAGTRVTPGPDAPVTAVRLEWTYRGVPESQMRLYELAPEARTLPLWRTATAASFSEIPAAEELPGVVRLRAGESKRFLLVLHNGGKKAVRFFAAPHHVHPDEASLGFEFACLCRNHIYEAAPGGYWYRVVELSLDPDAGGGELMVRHALIAAPSRKRSGR